MRVAYRLFIGVAGLLAAAPLPADVDFNQDIRPILSNHCYQCHGPDAEHREAGLRFDVFDADVPGSAVAELESGLRAIVAGDADASELVNRIHSGDEFVVMPPPETNKPLTDAQKATLVQWIREGAPFEKHWSLVPPEKSSPPQPPEGVRVANEIDAFVTARYAGQGLTQNPPADRITLIRRLSLDLTGLPPTPDEVDAFAADDSPEAYERLVDRLLASPHYGEHMTRFWLDLVRYADTHGMHFDNYREMWPYRDWVVRSFNENKSYADFLTEQLAGDLLPEPTREQLVASGFNRLNVTTNEGGSIYEEVFARNVIDRTEAFGTVFLGLTAGCAQCHDHKFDPISQKDFYSLTAFFNSLDGRAMDENVKDHAPSIVVPTAEQEAELAVLTAAEDQADAAFLTDLPAADAAQQAWEQTLEVPTPEYQEPQWSPMTASGAESSAGGPLEIGGDGVVRQTGDVPGKADFVLTYDLTPLAGQSLSTLRLHFPPEGTNGRVGRSPNGNVVITEIEVGYDLSDGMYDPVKVINPSADHTQDGDEFAVATAFDGKLDAGRGWALAGHQKEGGRTLTLPLEGPVEAAEGARLRVTLKQQSQYAGHVVAGVRAEASEGSVGVAPVTTGPWHLTGPFPVETIRNGLRRNLPTEGKAFDASQSIKYGNRTHRWTERPDFTNGLVHEVPAVGERTSAVLLHRVIRSPLAQSVRVLIDTTDAMQLHVNGKMMHRVELTRPIRPLTSEFVIPLNAGDNTLYLKIVTGAGKPVGQFTFAVRSQTTRPEGRLATIADTPPAERTAEDAARLRDFYRRVVSEVAEVRTLRKQFSETVAETEKYRRGLPTTLIFRELDTPRQARVLIRGQYDTPGEEVPRAVPASLPAMSPDLPQNRLGLARWLLADEHPLTARVAVNRYWQQLFGTGLVKTSEDLGAQGEPPTHPQLLDWLSVDFRENGWDVKRLVKQIVMSETYRQSSRIDPAERAADPENRYLARGSRHRLDAETLRDQALSVAGLLNDKLGGPGVKPPQPEGLWKAVAFVGSNTGEFKASEGGDIYRRSVYILWKRTAHAPMMSTFDAPNRESCTARRERTNTPLQALLLMNEEMYVEAARVLASDMIKQHADDAARVAAIFRRASGRAPTDAETGELLSLLADARTITRTAPQEAARLLEVGRTPADGSLDPAELAAWTVVANTVLNLDEVVTRR